MKCLVSGGIIVIAITCVLPAQVASRQQRRYETVQVVPIDESRSDRSLRVVLDELAAAIASGNDAAVIARMTPKLRAEMTRLNDTEMKAFARLLRLGGAYTVEWGATSGRREFCLPYAYAKYPYYGIPQSFIDAMGTPEAWVVVGSGVAVRQRASIDSPLMARLAYELVGVNASSTRDESGASWKWHGVYLPDGRYGYVATEWLFSFQDDLSVCLVKADGEWQITKVSTGPPV